MPYKDKSNQSISSRNHYLKNKEKMKAMAKERKIRTIEKSKAFVNRVKAIYSCFDCGLRNPLVMEFDHVHLIKIENISTMIYNGTSLNKIKNEIRKCEMVCANCHRIRTHNRRQ